MKRILSVAIACLACTALADELDLSDLLGAEPEPERSKFIVHEWGSINLVQDSDRAVISGLVDDQSDLPPFVDVWTEQPRRAAFPMVIEKPILYFYSKETIFANVKVRCPSGILTQWWPKASRVNPTLPPEGEPLPPLKNGSLEWNVVAVTPHVESPEFRDVGKHSWWPTARKTDAAVVRVNGGEEKFLFYRGAARVTSALGVQVNVDGSFELKPASPDKPVRHVFTMNVPDEGDPQLRYSEVISKDRVKTEAMESVDAAAETLRKILLSEGMYEKEADGLIKIWREGMFETPGLRAMYLMEPEDLKAFLPLTIQPDPDEIKRVMLVRIECLTPDREQRILTLIEQLGAESYKQRRAAQLALQKVGRIGQAIMRRYHANSDDPEIRMRLKTILKQISPQRPRAAKP